MGLFSKRDDKPPAGAAVRGGCAAHDMRGPKRDSVRAAERDAREHGKRMHGSKVYSGAYIETVER